MTKPFENIVPTDLRDYAKSLGWIFNARAVERGVFMLSHNDFDRRQLVFSLDTSAADYLESVEITINKLSELTNKSVNTIVNEIEEIKDDTIRFRIVDSRNSNSSIPFTYAVNALNGAKELLLAAASSVLKPQAHHPRLSRSEATNFIESTKFHQTEKSSFVLKVSSPVKAIDNYGDLFGTDTPFVRQTTLTLNLALKQLVDAIKEDRISVLIDEIKSENNPYISSNLCHALTSFKEDRSDIDLYVNFNWAYGVQLPKDFVIDNSIRIQRDYFSIIDDVRRELRTTESEKDKEEKFIATVEQLAGEIDGDTRSGDVILNLYLGETEVVKARTSLNHEQYIEADKAHMKVGTFINIHGILHPGNQPRNLTDISLFEIIQ